MQFLSQTWEALPISVEAEYVQQIVLIFETQQ